MYDTLPPLPTFVRRRNGRLVPFDPDHICRSVFAASSRLGRADAFLARELTDGLLHFLSTDADAIPTTEQIRELSIKVVRELGQPALAAALSDDRPATPSSPTTLFGPDLVAAHHDGLLTLGAPETPLELDSCVLKPPDGLAALRQVCGQTAILDGPEHTLVREGRSTANFAQEVIAGLRAAHLRAVVNLNTSPPPWADDLADGPLFAAQRCDPDPRDVVRLADELLDALAADPVRVDWHLSTEDFQPPGRARLERVAALALRQSAIAFVFDRVRHPVALAEGVDRRHPAVLLMVGLNLPRLAEQVLPELQTGRARPDAAQRFLSKLPSLARMALSAGLQKRDYLRRHALDRPGLTREFLLDRARLVVTPIGLERLLQTLLARGLCSGGAALDLGRRIVVRLREVLRAEGRAARLDTCLDGMAEGAGLTAWDAEASPKDQLHAAGHLHAGSDTGSATVFVPPPITAAELAGLLLHAWQRTEMVRFRFTNRPDDTHTN